MAMAVSSQLSLLVLVAAAASLHFPSLMIDARATPSSNFGVAVADRGHALYGGGSGITGDALYRIESQFDDDDVDDKDGQQSHVSFEAEPKSTNAASKAATLTGANGFGADPNGNGERTSYRFGDDRFDRHDSSNNNNDVIYNTNAVGSKQPELGTQSTGNPNNFYSGGASANTNPNTHRYFGMSDTRRPVNQRLYYNAAKGVESSTELDNVNGNGQGPHGGFEDNKKPGAANQRLYYNAANGMESSTELVNVNGNGQGPHGGFEDNKKPGAANQRLYYNAANGMESSTELDNVNGNGHGPHGGFEDNKKPQNEYPTMEEYYKRQGIQDQP